MRADWLWQITLNLCGNQYYSLSMSAAVWALTVRLMALVIEVCDGLKLSLTRVLQFTSFQISVVNTVLTVMTSPA